MWSLTSLRTKRIRSFGKFRLLPPKDFFDSIGQTETGAHRRDMSVLPPGADMFMTGRFAPENEPATAGGRLLVGRGITSTIITI
jgi:hypothetical protein